MKTKLFLLLFGLAAVTATAGDFSDFRETNRVSLTDTFLSSNMGRPEGSRHAVVNASNLLESLLGFSNWPASGAGDVTTAQLNTASNAVWMLMTNSVTITSNSLWTAIANLQGGTNGLHTLVQALLSQTNSLGIRISALEAASSGGSSNMPVATLGSLFITNAFYRGMTNLTGDATDFRLTGPNWAWTKPTNNQLINFVAPAANATFGVEGYLFILSTGAAHTITFSNIVALNELVVLGSTTSVFRVINDRTNTFVMSLQDRTTGSGAVVLSNAPVIVNGTLVTPTIASFVNATHSHENAAGGGTLSAAAIGSGTVDAARLPTVLQNLNGNPIPYTNMVVGGWGIALVTNSGVVTATLTNRAAGIVTNATSATADFSDTANVNEYFVGWHLTTNLVISPTNLVQGRTVRVYFPTNSLTYDVMVTNTAGTVVRWNRNVSTNGSTSFTKTNTIEADLYLKVETNGVITANLGIY
jgi:hypothetical protein